MPEEMKIPTLRTPVAHKDHTEEKVCDCAESLEEAYFACKCGSLYGIGVFNFHYFYCYDCGASLRRNYLNDYMNKSKDHAKEDK